MKDKYMCIYLDFEVDEILFLNDLLDGTAHKSYILNDVMFRKGDGDDSYYVYQTTTIPNTTEGKATVEYGFRYTYYSKYGMPFLFTGYWTNRLGLDNLVKNKVGKDFDTGKAFVQDSLF